MDLRHEDSLQAICCQVVRYPHVKTLSLSVPKDALVGEVTRFVKQEFPSDYKDVSAARTKVLALLKGGRYMPLGGLMESRLPARICDFGLGFVQDLLREDSRELNLNGKMADQLPPPTNEKCVIYLAALVPCKLLACLIIGGFEEDDDFFYHGIHEGWTMRDFKIYLMKTQPVPADFKLVLATDGDQSLLCEEVVVEERNERVTTVMNALAAQEEIDLSRTVRSVFGDDSSLSCVDVLIVEQDGILGKRKDRPVSGGVLLQSVRALPPLRGLLHVMKQISDFVINIPDTIDLAAREGWARVVRAHGEALPCSLDAMDDAAARGHLEVVKWLHEHHPEWNTRYGLADAVVNGHPEVVDWLIEYGRDWDFNWKHYERFDCSEIMLKHLEEKRKSYPITCPIVEAAAAGWLDEIERLHCNVSAYKIKFAMAEAARHNQVEVITYLIKRYKTYSTRLAVETAAAVGHTKILGSSLMEQV